MKFYITPCYKTYKTFKRRRKGTAAVAFEDFEGRRWLEVQLSKSKRES